MIKKGFLNCSFFSIKLPFYLKLLCCLIPVAVSGYIQTVHANPEGGVVSAGDAVIHNNQSQVEITQQSHKAVIDWQSFNIEANEKTKFIQPSNDAIALNRIHSNTASEIKGQLTANGKLILINQNGILFGQIAKVDVNGLIATTANISNDKFMQQDLAANSNLFKFDEPGVKDSKIINAGQITAKDGLVGLVAPHVVNSGLIIAKAAKVHLASGETFALDLYGDNLINVAISDDLENQLVLNSGKIVADGNKIALTAAAGKQLVNSLIANSGALQAKSVAKNNGEIIIMAEGSNAVINNAAELKGIKSGESKILVSGTIDVSGLEPGESGGKVQILGDNIGLIDNAVINASGHTGKYNTTLGLDNSAKRTGSAGGEILVGGDYLGKGKVPAARMLTVDPTVTIYSDSNEIGDAGRIIFWSDGVNKFNGKVYARSLGGITGNNYGNGGFVETSGKQLIVNGYVDLTAANGTIGTYLLDPSYIYILSNTATLQANTNRTKLYYVSEDGITEIRANYFSSLGSNVQLKANNIIFNTQGDVMNLGTRNLSIFGDSINVASPGSITFTTGNLNINSKSNLVLTNLGLSSTSGTINVSVLNDAKLTLGSVTAGALYLETQGANSSLNVLATKIPVIASDGYFSMSVGGSVMFDLQGQNEIIMPLNVAVDLFASKIVGINVGQSLSSNVPFTVKGGNRDFSVGYTGTFGSTFDLSKVNFSSLNTLALAATDANVILGDLEAGILDIALYGSNSTLNCLATKPIKILANGSYSLSSESGSLVFDFEGQDNISFPSATGSITAATFSFVNIGAAKTNIAPCTINPGDLSFVIAGTDNVDFSNVTFNNTAATISVYTDTTSYVKLGNINSKVLNVTAGSISFNNATADNISLTANGDAASNLGDISIAPTNEILTTNLSLNANNNIIFDTKSNLFTLRNNGTLNGIAFNAIKTGNSSAPTNIQLANAGNVVNLTADKSININNMNITGPTGSTVNITANAGSITLGSMDVGTTIIKAIGIGSHIILPENKQLILTGSGTVSTLPETVLTLNAAGGNIYNKNPEGFSAFQIVGSREKAYHIIISSNNDNNENVVINYVDVNSGVNILGGTLSGSYIDKDASGTTETGKTVTVSNLLLTGPDSSNYVLADSTVSGAVGIITAKDLTASLTGTVIKVYDGGTKATVTGEAYTLTGYVPGDDVILKQI
jgi:filamentous hemagglutinin family protein